LKCEPCHNFLAAAGSKSAHTLLFMADPTPTLEGGIPMGDRTVPERISEFLVRCAGRPYCDHCIQERLGLRWRQQVQLVTATLAVTAEYRRNMAACCTCNDTKQVITYHGTTNGLRAGPMLSLPRMGRGTATQAATEQMDCAPLASSGSLSGPTVLAAPPGAET
jgi:hypothetical protein